MAADPGRRLGWFARLVLLVFGSAAAAAPVYLLPTDEHLQWLLGYVFSPAMDLADPELLATWRILLAAAAGVVVAVVLLLSALLVRSRVRRSRARRAAAAPLGELRKALRSRQSERIARAARRIAQERGDEVVPELLEELRRQEDPDSRHELAAALYQIGRAVTAEVELLPRG